MVEILRTWVKVRNKDVVFQLTRQMAEREPPRLGVDMDIITEAEARAIQKRAVKAKEQAAIDRRTSQVSKALEMARQQQIQAELEATQRKRYEAAVAAQQGAEIPVPPASVVPVQPAAVASFAIVPETPEQVEARLAAEEAAAVGGETGKIREDDLDEKNRKELFEIIETEELPVKKAGNNKALVIAIRETRRLVQRAKDDAAKNAPPSE